MPEPLLAVTRAGRAKTHFEAGPELCATTLAPPSGIARVAHFSWPGVDSNWREGITESSDDTFEDSYLISVRFPFGSYRRTF